MTLAALLRELTARLQAGGVPDAPFEAKQLLLSVLGLDATTFLLRLRDPAEGEQADEAFALADRRIGGEPLQYLLGCWNFLEESFFVGPGVLIPRPETEELVLICEKLLRPVKAPVILDLCAGSGCIGLSLLKRREDARLTSVEYDEGALLYLRKNAENLGVADRAQILCGDVLRGPSALGALPQADLIVSNPPYIRSCELDSLQREVRREPRLALDGGADGLRFYRCFASRWADAIKPDGLFAFECGEGQGKQISALFEAQGFSAEIVNDFNGFDRFVIASRGRKDLL